MSERPITVLTGATSGLGVPLAAALAAAGHRLVLGARSSERAARAEDAIRGQVPRAQLCVLRLDLASLQSVRAFADALGNSRIDRLVLNAGLMTADRRLTEDHFETMLGTNLLGHAALLGHLRQRLEATDGSRVVVQSSEAHRHGSLDLNDPMGERRFRGLGAYNASKLAIHVLAVELDRHWPVEFVVSQPGWVDSDLGRHITGSLQRVAMTVGNRIVGQTPAEGARSAVRATLDTNLPGAATGRYVSPTRLGRLRGEPAVIAAHAKALDPALGRAVLAMSERFTGVGLVTAR